MSQTTSDSAIRHTQTWRGDATTRALGAVLAILVSLAVLGYAWPDALDALRYERDAVLEGDLWRLLTTHLVHADASHLVLNMLGTAFIAALFPQTYTVRQWAFVLLVSALSVDLGLLALNPDLGWYLGASGMLHGALVAGAIGWWRSGERGMSIALGIALLGKLAWEQWQGALPLMTDLAVIVDSHAYGAFGGLIGGAVVGVRRRQRQSRSASL